jgi:hypothetical protein
MSQVKMSETHHLGFLRRLSRRAWYYVHVIPYNHLHSPNNFCKDGRMTEHNWSVVATAIAERMDELAWDQATLVRVSGLSDPFVRGMMNGTPRGSPRPANLRRLAIGLGWTPDSIDRLLAGEDPVENGTQLPNHTDPQADLIARMERFMAFAQERRADIDQMLARIERLQDTAVQAVNAVADLGEAVLEQRTQLRHIDDFVRRREAALELRPGELAPR